ncbi:MAG TPA: PEP/pyruvate-binding domain-containing protein [Myxococcota bacterium]|nr:PEP/pyruvate-binding domain-containing protein [Myxococcota bacterium]HRY91888.1 PEP/pyruvate-binding domain-containing protein [Myxococcota bacterium]HSA22373.1 PEP/pyruvate-binding domain-containing protein [Myxococcota bacterium]
MSTARIGGNGKAACIPLAQAHDLPVGGKAQGLSHLLRLGLPVPAGFVILGASLAELPHDLEQALEGLGGGPVAVRSSALGEDSAEASFAGQYRTILDVQGFTALREAVRDCLASLDSRRAEAYRERRAERAERRMSVVVQRMVASRAAGVLFTADPVSGRRNCVLVDAVAGQGEQLVSGHAEPDRYRLGRDGRLLRAEAQGARPLLDEQQLRALVAGALTAEAALGQPLDLEWALDRDGRLYWLQARPITALPADPNELDCMQAPGDHYTSGNVGECMPGAITPLAFSTVWWANDRGLQVMQVEAGARASVVERFTMSRLYYGRLFLNLTAMGRIGTQVVGASAERLGLAITGRHVPDLDPGPPAARLTRLRNGLRYARYLASGERFARELERLVAGLDIPQPASAQEAHAAIGAALPCLFEAFEAHLGSSAGAGALESALPELLARGGRSLDEALALMADLLAQASAHDVESADILAGVERVVDALEQAPRGLAELAGLPAAAALAWLRGPGAGEAGRRFADHLARHGHRSIRELELRQPEWAADPLPLVESIQSSCRARLQSGRSGPRPAGRPTGRPAPRLAGWLRTLVRWTQSAVRRREHTKSLLVKVVARFKAAYRHLGARLAAEGLLPDEDLVFFLTHAELGRLLAGERALAGRAEGRRRALDYQMGLELPDVFTHSPEPISPEEHPPRGGELRGKPVSRGVVTGPARVARTVEEAAGLRPGEILIAPVTDVAWSPYFAVIAGLATDVGSSVSHGAVVAREFGLPAVVGLRHATRTFRTGDRVVLDADRGSLSLAPDSPQNHGGAA